MAKILGLDLGTNSIGWAVVEKSHSTNEFEIIDKGVRIFQEGVKIEKGVESSKAAERTAYRSARRLKYRRKLRKIATLKVLSEYGFCPKLEAWELRLWRTKKKYPENDAFLKWQKTNEQENINPYYFRAIAVEKKLDLKDETNRFIIGRAFYHIAQRRGFLSNRLDSSQENDGLIKTEVEEINKAKGDLTLGQFYYKLHQKGGKIRGRHTHREEHYLNEFKRICSVQQIPEEISDKLKKAIFFQRPLKSKKGLVGRCPFEKNKARCPISHPQFEEFRMYSFINNIKIKYPEEDHLRRLTPEEEEQIKPLFFRKSKEHFSFEDIAKKLVRKGWPYAYYKSKERTSNHFLFNYQMNFSVSGCRTIAQFREIFGENWKVTINQSYQLKDQKTGEKTVDEKINDIWHVLFSFDKPHKLVEFAEKNLGLNEKQASLFSKISLKQDYGSLSLKAIRKILPLLKDARLPYPHAVFMAKLDNIVPPDIWENKKERNHIQEKIEHIIETQNQEKTYAEIINGIINLNKKDGASWSDNEFWQKSLKKDIHKKLQAHLGNNFWNSLEENEKEAYFNEIYDRVKKQMQNNLGRGTFIKSNQIDERIKEFLGNSYKIPKAELDKLYHPSALEVYKDALKSADGNYYLGSPMISSIRNPMAMRTLHQLRKVVNHLIKEGTIDRNTKVNIETTRDLKNANERKALQRWQRSRQTKHDEYRGQIQKDYKAATGKNIEPTEIDILKYQLWEEQNHVCLYTGENIGVAEFIGENPKYDIEHTIPRSLSFDNSQENLTLCNSEYNRKIKRNRIPFELPNHSDILSRLEHWKRNIEEADKSVKKATYQSKINSDNKDKKDAAIQRKHLHQLDLFYWRNKYKRFEMKDVPEGFKNSQLVDSGIIAKYARLYLKTAFSNVYTVKGKIVSDFRQLWGIQNMYVKKERVNHLHHCIDAIVIACITKDNYEKLAKAYHEWEEDKRMTTTDMPKLNPPIKDLPLKIRNLENEILVSHYTPDNLPKMTKKRLRVNGKIQYDKQGKPIIQQGDSVRGSLHKETNYGAIKRTIINKNGETEEKILYVVRKPVDSISASDIKNIVDHRIRCIIEKGKEEETLLKKKLEQAEKQLKDAEAQEEITNLQIQIDELKNKIAKLFSLPTHNGKYVPIKKVRCYAPTVTDPIHLKKNRDPSQHEYKQDSHFVNDGNYIIAIYEGTDKKGNLKKDFLIINNHKAGKFYKASNKKETEVIIPETHKNRQLKYLIKTGLMILLWENHPDELWSISDITKRLYKVVKFDKNGRIVLRPHIEARPANNLKEEYYIDTNRYIDQLCLRVNKFTALVEGYDFFISPTGKLKRLGKHTHEDCKDTSG